MIDIAERIYSEMAQRQSYVFSTHPSNCIRIKALMEFYSSKTWKNLQEGKEIGPDKNLNKRMQSLLVLLSKIPLDEQERLEMHFLASAGLILMKADQEITKSEYDYLLNVLSQYIQWPPDYLNSINLKNAKAMMKKSARKILSKYPQKTRELAGKLVPIVFREGKIDDKAVVLFLEITKDELKIPISEVIELFLEAIKALFKPYS